MSIKSYIKIKPIKDDGPFSGSFDEIRKGINRTGEVVENIAKNNVETHKLIQFEKEWLKDTTEKEVEVAEDQQKDEEKGFKKWFKGFKDMFRLKKRREQEKKDEEAVDKEEPDKEKTKKEAAKSGAAGFLTMLGKILTPIFAFVTKMVLLKWLSNPEKAKRAVKVFNLIFAIGKFAFKIAKWGVGTLASGLINVFGAFKEGPMKGTFKLLLGALQLFAGFKTLEYLLNPLKIFSDGKKLFNLFNKTGEQEVEWKKQEQWRKFGYKDKESGKIYTEKEYKAMKKSVERQQKKLRAQGREGDARKVGAKFNNRVKNPTRLQKGKNIGGKLMKPGMQKGIAVVGGISRIASGIAMGEDKTQAVGAGIGQAAGGMLGAAAGTALLGPFLGPFAPIVGNAIGGFLGEWIGKTFLPMIKPLFEPIQKMFKMWWTIIQDVAKQTGITEFLGTFFQFVGQIGKVLMDVAGWIMKPLGWLLSGAIKVLGNVISFIIDAGKKIWAVMSTPGKVIRQIIWDRSLKNVGKDVKLEDMGAAQGGKVVVHKSRGGIVPFKESNIVHKMYGGSVYNHTTNLTNIEFSKSYSYSPIQQFGSGGKMADQGNFDSAGNPINIGDFVGGDDMMGPSPTPSTAPSPTSTPAPTGSMSPSRNVAPSDIQGDVDKRDSILKQFQYHNQRNSEIEDIVLPPRVIAIKTQVPIINTVVGGSRTRPIYGSPSPLFTC